MSKKLLISVAPLLAVVAFAVMPAVSQAAPQYYSNGKLLKAGEQVPTIAWGTLNLAAGTTTVTCQNAALAYVENIGGIGKSETDNFATANCTLSTGECKASQGLEVDVTPEELPWGAELESATFGGKETVRSRTLAEPPSTPGFSSGDLFLSTEGAQVTTHCEGRGEQPEVKQLIEALCKVAEPATSSATIYNPETREDATIEADGFLAYVLEAATACSGAGIGAETQCVTEDPPVPGDPTSCNVPGAAVLQCNGENAPHLKNGASAKSPSEVLFDQNGKNGGKAENSTTGTLQCGAGGPGTTTGSLKTGGYNESEVITTK